MFRRKKKQRVLTPGAVQIDKLLVAPTGPSLSTVQTLSSTNFEPIGQSFPYELEEVEEEGVRRNVEYVRRELRRWKRSIAVLADAVTDMEELASYDILLDCLLIKLNASNANQIDALLHDMLLPLAPWAGCVIRSIQESADLTRNVGISLVGSAEAIKAMGLSDLSQEHRIEVQSMMETIGKFVKQHEELQQVQNRLNEQRKKQEEKALRKEQSNLGGAGNKVPTSRWKRLFQR